MGGGAGFVEVCGIVWLQAPLSRTKGSNAVMMDREWSFMINLLAVGPRPASHGRTNVAETRPLTGRRLAMFRSVLFKGRYGWTCRLLFTLLTPFTSRVISATRIF